MGALLYTINVTRRMSPLAHLVSGAGLEPARLPAQEPKSCMSTDSISRTILDMFSHTKKCRFGLMFFRRCIF